MNSIYTLILFILLISSTSYANSKQKILILHSYHQSYKWTDDINKGIKSEFKDKFNNIELFVEYMDSKRYVDEKHYKNLFNTYTNKYKDINFDLIISSDNNAFNFIKKYNKVLFKKVPVVFNGVNYVKKEDIEGYDNFTGLSERADIKQNYQLIKKLQPNVKNIYTIIDDTTTGKIVKREAQKVFKELSQDGINYQIIDNLTFEQLKQKVQNFPKNSAILLSVFFRSKDNKFFEYDEISNMISSNSKTPLYGLWDFNLGNGIIGGYLSSGLFQGKMSALMGIEILKGKKVKEIPVKYKSPNNYMFDYPKILKYNLDFNLLPKESYIINKPIHFYEIYKNEIITLMVIFTLMFTLIILLIINIQKRKHAEKSIKKQLSFQQKLIDTVDAPIYYKDATGKYIGCNKAFERFLNTKKINVIGKTVYDVLPSKLAKIHASKDDNLLKYGGSQEYEGRHEYENDLIKNLIFYKSVFYDENNHIEGLVGAIFDITLLKEATNKLNDLNIHLEEKVQIRTQELEESNNELEYTVTNLKDTQKMLVESEKMASLGGLVAGVAHEINTPVGIGLTGITHFLDITEKIKYEYEHQNIDEEEFKEYLRTSEELALLINTNLVKTAELIKSFKQVAVDQTSEEKREFNIKEYIESTLLSINNIVKKANVTIKVQCEENLKIDSYPGDFSQIITNLVINSIRHAYTQKEKGNISIEVLKDNDILKLIYKDDGNGIPQQNLEKIFEPFFTTNREEGGTGLGLNIIYNIITSKLNGKILCNSKENQGVEFIITFPCN